jgi:MerR family transcriptional regulator, light-induced transcriptional regulator
MDIASSIGDLVEPWSRWQNRQQGGQTWSPTTGGPLRYNWGVGKGGRSVSATEFAALTGVSRERLRTWERRFGFPAPRRRDGGPRRYALADAARVVAVRRAAEEGIPLASAIASAAAGEDRAELSPATLAAAANEAPAALAIVGGPEPLTLRYVNAAFAAVPGAPEPDTRLTDLAWFPGSPLERRLHELFTGSARAVECLHPGWQDGAAPDRSMLYRLPADPGQQPSVVIVGLDRLEDRAARQEIAELREALEVVRASDARHARWLVTAAELAERFQRETGEAVLSSTSDTLVRRLRASDAGIAIYMGGELAMGSSSRGLLGPRMVTVMAYDDLVALLRDSVPGWLEPGTASAFGAPDGLHAAAVPIVVVGEMLGVLVLLFDQRAEIDADVQRLLSVVSAGLGFTILRDRLVEGARGGG